MKIQTNDSITLNPSRSQKDYGIQKVLIATFFIMLVGCGTSETKKQNTDFFTSGNRAADQRASQRMAKAEQLAGSSEGSGQDDVRKAKTKKETGDTNTAAQAEGKLTLFERLGGEVGIARIIDDFLPRAMNDPRVNWKRKGVSRGGFWLDRNQSVRWNATPQQSALLKKHMIQFIALATGGPTDYQGKEMKSAHAGLHITNPEFDAVVGDMKASLDKLQIPNKEQKELLAIAESTRPQIVTER